MTIQVFSAMKARVENALNQGHDQMAIPVEALKIILDQLEVISKSEWKLAGDLTELQMNYNVLKAKLENPVVLPAGYSTRAGHPFHEGERNVMIPNKDGDWLSRFDVEHAIHVAGFPFTVEGK